MAGFLYSRLGFQKFNLLFLRASIRQSSTVAANKSLKTIKDIPGHPSYFGLGTAIRLLRGKLFMKKPLLKFALEAQFIDVKAFGSIYVTEMPGVKVVNLSDPDDVAKVMRSEPKYPKRLDLPIVDYYRELRKAKPGVFFANGEDWYRYRRTVSKRILQPREVAEYVPVFNDIVTDFISRIDSIRLPAGSDRENEVTNIDNELFKWSFESVAYVLFDRRFGSLGNEVNPVAQDLINSVDKFLHAFIPVIMIPLSVHKIFKTKTFKDFFHHFDAMYEYTELFIAKKLEELKNEGKLDDKTLEGPTKYPEKVGFLELLLTKENLSEDDLIASIIDLLIGGVDTTANTMQWVLYAMAKNQDKQDKLFHEISNILGQDEVEGFTSLTKMPYLKACIKETMRLYPLASTINRTIPEDMEIQGYNIPKGTTVVMLMHYMSRNGENFTEPDKFVPERWLRNEKNALEAIHPFTSLPFGFGTRMCAGRRIAELELYLLVTRLIQKYNITYPDDEIVEPFMRGATIPDRPLRVKFIDRG